MKYKPLHVVDLVVSLLTVLCGWLMNELASGKLTLPAAAITVLSIGSHILTLVAPSVSAAVNAAAVRVATTCLMLGLMLVALVFAPACVGGVPTAQTIQGITAGADTVICILDGYASDVEAGMTQSQIETDLEAKCGADALTTVKTIASAKRAAAARPALPPAPAAGH